MKSKWLKPSDSVPEMAFEDLRLLMRNHFGIVTEPAAEKPYASRFIGPPFNSFHPDCLSIVVTAHNRGTVVSPHNIKALLVKFDITEAQFREAFNSFMGQPPEAGRANTLRPN